jgi:hypothetical protein
MVTTFCTTVPLIKAPELRKTKLHADKNYDFQISANIPTVCGILYATEEKFYVFVGFIHLSSMKNGIKEVYFLYEG